MPRPIIPGDGRALNRRIAAALAEQVYTLELENAPASRVWAYRKAAWAVDDLPQNIGLVYQQMGIKGLKDIPEIGPSLALEIERMVKEWGTATDTWAGDDLPLFRPHGSDL
jgi:DNA polymerase/3'-5' exonuclease PolX